MTTKRFSLAHLDNDALLRDLATLVRQEFSTTAAVLAHIAEVDARKLYLPAAYPSMYEYCVRELRLSEDAAFKRIRAARTAREYPAIFEALADGRLTLNAVILLASYLTAETADELLAAAAHKTRSEIEQLLAERFPRSEMLPLIEAMPASRCACQLAARPVVLSSLNSSPQRADSTAPRSNVAPIAPERFALHCTVGQSTHEKLLYAHALLGHAVPSGELAQVLDRALDALIDKLEKRKFAATARPRRRRQRASTNRRHIPAEVKRAVWERDGGRCTFVSDAGKRCNARMRLEYDHADPVARGGTATVDRIRLRCRAHNQFAAECADFMEQKRQGARRAREEARSAREDARRVRDVARRAAAEKRARAAADAKLAAERDVVPWLRALGVRADEARRAAAYCESMGDASLEERVRAALASLAPPQRRVSALAGAREAVARVATRAAGPRPGATSAGDSVAAP